MGSILGGKELGGQPRVGLAWQRVAGWWFFGGSGGDRPWGRSLPFFQIVQLLYLVVILVCDLTLRE